MATQMQVHILQINQFITNIKIRVICDALIKPREICVCKKITFDPIEHIRNGFIMCDVTYCLATSSQAASCSCVERQVIFGQGDLFGKRVQRCYSLLSVALRSFLNDTQVSENTTRPARMRFYLLVETQ